MKGLKITALILTAAIGASVLTACNNEKKPVSSGINIISTQNQGMAGEEMAIIDPNALTNNYVFKFNGISVTVNIDPKGVVDKLGEYKYDEKPGCATQGMNHYYIYGSSFTITAVPTDKKNYAIESIVFNDDSVSTGEGVVIGNTIEQVKAAYGEPTSSNENYLFEYIKGTSALRFIFDDDGKVQSIYYASNNQEENK